MKGQKEISPGAYKRFDGKLLTVLNVAPHTEGNYKLVIYFFDDQPNDWLATPEDVFHEVIPGQQIPRFQRMTEKASNAT